MRLRSCTAWRFAPVSDAARAARNLLKNLSLEAVVVTLDREGISGDPS